MSTEKLKYVSLAVANRLMTDVAVNIKRYRTGDFVDLAQAEGWGIELSLEVDLEPLQHLRTDDGPEAEVENSMLIWRALGRLTPALAGEGRIWTRLTHLEGLSYSRRRWLEGVPGAKVAAAITTHFFADTRTRCRDDNALGRLWWAAYIAHVAVPDDQKAALRAMLKSADIRSNVIERPWVSSRPKIAAAIVRTITRKPEVTDSQTAFREFMKSLNRLGGGVVFEAMSDQDVDVFMDGCFTSAN
jgi:hypothetical protein